ncbi:MAG: hypothetical protein HY886_03500 [Deltaproteobacteria bacterium]|nr:hypothetical protein [Deltaproteobacteria bacterium]
MKTARTLTIACMIAVFLLCTTATRGVAADSTMKTTVNDALYGGLLGTLVGTAVLLLTDKPGDHLNYIPTGAGIGVLFGAAYGLATSGVVQSVGEIEGSKFTLNAPTIRKFESYDKVANKKETTAHVGLLSVRF